MKFLIAGLGSIGRRHLKNLVTLGENNILLYRTHQSSLPDDDLAGFPVETDLETALAAVSEAVIVSNPTALHMQVAIPAAERGLHLLLEKPVSHSLEEARTLQKVAAKTGSRVLVGFQFRFHPGLIRLKALLEQGAIGKPAAVRAHWGEYLPGWHPWEDFKQGYSARPELGGGVILTLSHPLDYLRFLFGEVQDLWAFYAANSDLDLEVEDTAEIGLRFTSGVLGSVHLDYIQRPPSHWLEVTGTQGTLRWDNSTGAVQVYRAGSGTWEHANAPPGFERNHLFLEQMRHFLAVIRQDVMPICTLEDGVKALELALGAIYSAQSGSLVRLYPSGSMTSSAGAPSGSAS
jgi:predicted dehydrogenase